MGNFFKEIVRSSNDLERFSLYSQTPLGLESTASDLRLLTPLSTCPSPLPCVFMFVLKAYIQGNPNLSSSLH